MLSSKLLDDAVESLSTLPSIGKKSALRLALHMVQSHPDKTRILLAHLDNLIHNIKYCSSCSNLSDYEICSICQDNKRDRSTICVVETFRDIIAIEETGQYRGVYHVLGGVISPIDGVGPSDLKFDHLLERVRDEKVKEIILAVNPTLDGETTNFYLHKILEGKCEKISAIARGVSYGGELEYADGLTLGHSIISRRPYHLVG